MAIRLLSNETIDGTGTFAGNLTVQSGNKLILNRPNNGIDCELSTDSAGTLILNSRNGEGFDFQNAGTQVVKINDSGVVKIQGSENTLLRLISDDANVFLELRDNNSTNGNFIGTIGDTMPFYTNNTLALTLDASQNATFSGDVSLADSKKINIGSGNDLQIFHTGSVTTFDNFTGSLQFVQAANNADIIFQNDDGSGGLAEYFRIDGGSERNIASKELQLLDNVYLTFGSGRDLRLIHDGSNNFLESYNHNLFIDQNFNDGDITFRSDDGSGAKTTYFVVDGGVVRTRFYVDTEHRDSVKARFGNSGDLQIYHNGSSSFINNLTGAFILRQSQDDGNLVIQCDDGSGGVTEYYRADGGSETNEFSKPTNFAGSGTFLGDVSIGSNTAAAPRLFFNKAASGNAEIKFNNVGSEKASIQLDSAEDLHIFANVSQKIKLRSGGADTLTLDSSQNATFAGEVDVNGVGAFGGTGSFRTFVTGSASGSIIEFGTNADNDSLGALGTFASAFIFTTNQGLGFKWQQGGSDKMILTSGGNLGIGTTSPIPKLHLKYTGGSYGSDATSGFINEATTGRGTMRIRSTTDNPAELFFDVNGGIRWDISCRNGVAPNLNFYPQGSTPGLNAVSAHTLQLQQNGNVVVTGNGSSGKFGVRTTSPSYELEVVGQGYFSSHLYAHCLGIGTPAPAANGVIRAAGDIIAYYSSDKNLKDNITKIEKPLEKIQKINGYEFDWNDKQELYEGHDVGVVAQEIEEVYPQLVETRKDGYKAVKYEKLVPLLIESIKELKKEIDNIKTRSWQSDY